MLSKCCKFEVVWRSVLCGGHELPDLSHFRPYYEFVLTNSLQLKLETFTVLGNLCGSIPVDVSHRPAAALILAEHSADSSPR